MEKKVTLIISLFLVVIIALTACGQKAAPQSQNSETKEAKETTKETDSAENKSSKKTYTMKIGLVLPLDHTNGKGALKFAELVKEKTNGQVKVDVYPSSQLGGEKEITDALTMGTLEFALIGMGDVAKRYKPALVLDGPFVFRDREHLIKVFKSQVFKDMVEEMAQKINVRVIGPLYYGTRHVTTGKVAAKTPDDLKGIKLRCPDQPMYVETVKVLGATPTPMAFSEVYLALQQGVVDAQENPVATIKAVKFNEVQKYLIKTAHIVQPNHILASEKVLKSLPDDIRKAILEAGAEAAEWTVKEAFAAEDKIFEELKAGGMTIIEPERALFEERAKELHKKYAKQWGEGLLEKIQAVK